jgi:transcription elongation factor/antiterminator RfaH
MWYAVYTKARHEKKVNERLKEKGIETFLPLIKTLRQWKDRKKWVELPLFNNYLFVNIDYEDRFHVLQTDGVSRIVSFNGKPVVVPDWQIESIRKVLTVTADLKVMEFFQSGDLVEVTQGPFKGVRGYVLNKRKKDRIVISIEGIYQSVVVEVLPQWLKRID